MTDLDQGFLVLGLTPLLLTGLVLWWFARSRGDQIWTGITPGEVPAPSQAVGTTRVRGGGEYAQMVAVRFTPPDAVTPGLAGVVLDGRADFVDLSATMIDLAVRGYLHLEALRERMPHVDVSDPADRPKQPEQPEQPEQPNPAAGTPPHDFRLTRTDKDASDLRAFERAMLDALFAGGASTTLSELKRSFGMTLRQAQVDLYRECVSEGWYRQHPRTRSTWLSLIGIPLVLAGIALTVVVAGTMRSNPLWGPFEFALPLGLALSGILLLVRGRGRTPRTAAGTALRIQTMGFRRYLTTAEASQIRFEEASDVFSRYLPYAIVFGVADRWASLFGEVAARAHASGLGDALFDLAWIDGWDALDLAFHAAGALPDADLSGLIDALDGPEGLTGLADVVGDSDLIDATAQVLGQVAEGVGEFVSSASDVVSLGDGCDLLDGCGCDL